MYRKTIRLFDLKLRLKRGLQRIEVVAVPQLEDKAALLRSPHVAAEEGQAEPDSSKMTSGIRRSQQEEEDDAMFACMPAGADDEYFRLLKLKEACVLCSLPP